MRPTVFRAMGTEVVALGAKGESAIIDWFETAEDVFSRFRPNSELSRVNQSSSVDVEVSGPLASCLRAARDLSDRTGGLVDPVVGAAVADWGYDRTFAEVSDRNEEPSVAAAGEWTISQNVVTRSPGTRLDLGGIAKGWTSDKAVEGGLASVVSAGGDIRSAHADTLVEIEDPWGNTALRVHLGVGGLATSSTTRRTWTVAGKPANHVIDPRTMAPAFTPVFSATVLADTAVEAEVGAKAVLLHGEHGLVWAEKQPWIRAALIVWRDGSVYATTGWEQAA